MKISKLLDGKGLSLSFEVFPPKTDAAFESIKGATEQIASLSPAFMSVTYGAGGGTSRYTIEIAKNIQDTYSVPTLAHLTCVSSTKETVRQRIADMKDAGIENVMALRGDIPADVVESPREYKHAIELVRELRESGYGFCIGGACYPEVHPESISAELDMAYLKEKVDAGLDFLTTQMFFDNHLYYDFVDRAVAKGISIPVVPGIMPITNVKQVDRAITLSGSYLPSEFLSSVEKYGHDPFAMTEVGILYATRQIADLFINGIKNVHVYTMNKPEVAKAIINNLSDIIGK